MKNYIHYNSDFLRIGTDKLDNLNIDYFLKYIIENIWIAFNFIYPPTMHLTIITN